MRFFAKDRTTPIRYLDFLPQLPDCLTAALYEYRLLQRDLKTLVKLMDDPIFE